MEDHPKFLDFKNNNVWNVGVLVGDAGSNSKRVSTGLRVEVIENKFTADFRSNTSGINGSEDLLNMNFEKFSDISKILKSFNEASIVDNFSSAEIIQFIRGNLYYTVLNACKCDFSQLISKLDEVKELFENCIILASKVFSDKNLSFRTASFKSSMNSIEALETCWPEILELVSIVTNLNSDANYFFSTYKDNLKYYDFDLPKGLQIKYLTSTNNLFSHIHLYKKVNSLPFIYGLMIFNKFKPALEYLLDKYKNGEKLKMNPYRKLLPRLKDYLNGLERKNFQHYIASLTNEAIFILAENFGYKNYKFLSLELLKLHLKAWNINKSIKAQIIISKSVDEILEKYHDMEMMQYLKLQNYHKKIIKNHQIIAFSLNLFKYLQHYDEDFETIVETCLKKLETKNNELLALLKILVNIDLNNFGLVEKILNVLCNDFSKDLLEYIINFAITGFKLIENPDKVFGIIIGSKKIDKPTKEKILLDILIKPESEIAREQIVVNTLRNEQAKISYEMCYKILDQSQQDWIIETEKRNKLKDIIIEKLEKEDISLLKCLKIIAKIPQIKLDEGEFNQILKMITIKKVYAKEFSEWICEGLLHEFYKRIFSEFFVQSQELHSDIFLKAFLTVFLNINKEVVKFDPEFSIISRSSQKIFGEKNLLNLFLSQKVPLKPIANKILTTIINLILTVPQDLKFQNDVANKILKLILKKQINQNSIMVIREITKEGFLNEPFLLQNLINKAENRNYVEICELIKVVHSKGMLIFSLEEAKNMLKHALKYDEKYKTCCLLYEIFGNQEHEKIKKNLTKYLIKIIQSPGQMLRTYQITACLISNPNLGLIATTTNFKNYSIGIKQLLTCELTSLDNDYNLTSILGKFIDDINCLTTGDLEHLFSIIISAHKNSAFDPVAIFSLAFKKLANFSEFIKVIKQKLPYLLKSFCRECENDNADSLSIANNASSNKHFISLDEFHHSFNQIIKVTKQLLCIANDEEKGMFVSLLWNFCEKYEDPDFDNQNPIIEKLLKLIMKIIKTVGDKTKMHLLEQNIKTLMFATNTERYVLKSIKNRKKCYKIMMMIDANFSQNIVSLLYNFMNDEKNMKNNDLRDVRRLGTLEKGIKNFGATCYVSVIIHMISIMPKLKSTIYKFKNNQSISSALNIVLGKLDYSLLSSVNSQAIIQNFLDYDNNPINKAEQMDALEFFIQLMDKLSNDLGNSVYNSMQFKIINKITCSECENVSETVEKDTSLSLEVKNKYNLNNCFLAYISPEIFEGDNLYSCEQCKRKVKAQKTKIFDTVPECLIISLKRFDYDVNQGQKIKLYDEIKIESEILLESESQGKVEYTLECMIIHCGTENGGHYIVFKKTSKGWIYANDTSALLIENFNVNRFYDHIKFLTAEHYEKATPYIFLFKMKNQVPITNPKPNETTLSTINKKNVEILWKSFFYREDFSEIAKPLSPLYQNSTYILYIFLSILFKIQIRPHKIFKIYAELLSHFEKSPNNEESINYLSQNLNQLVALLAGRIKKSSVSMARGVIQKIMSKLAKSSAKNFILLLEYTFANNHRNTDLTQVIHLFCYYIFEIEDNESEKTNLVLRLLNYLHIGKVENLQYKIIPEKPLQGFTNFSIFYKYLAKDKKIIYNQEVFKYFSVYLPKLLENLSHDQEIENLSEILCLYSSNFDMVNYFLALILQSASHHKIAFLLNLLDKLSIYYKDQLYDFAKIIIKDLDAKNILRLIRIISRSFSSHTTNDLITNYVIPKKNELERPTLSFLYIPTLKLVDENEFSSLTSKAISGEQIPEINNKWEEGSRISLTEQTINPWFVETIIEDLALVRCEEINVYSIEMIY